jgi:threonine dehydratase
MSVTLSDIQEVRRVLENIIVRTPTLADGRLSREIGANIYLKAECLQAGGSFKIRGAYNKISKLTEEEKKRGVVAASAGNHAQGVALAAQLYGIDATIVLPEYAPLTKINATRGYGAKVILKGKSFDEAMNYSFELAESEGFTHIHAFNDEKIIAGQGTIGLEIAEDVPQTSVIVVPIGGGGLISGISIAAKELLPGVRIVGVQAENCSPIKESLEAGEVVQVSALETIADGIAVKTPGEITFPIIQELVDEVVEVTEEEIARAIFSCVQNNRLVVEGAGAAGLAALMAGKINISDEDEVCVVLCGGNIDANLLARILEQVLVKQGRYIILKVLVPDRPKMLAGLTKLVGEAGANVIEVSHRRALHLAPLGRVGIALTLEVRDEKHGREIIKRLEKSGYHVEREGVGDWEE